MRRLQQSFTEQMISEKAKMAVGRLLASSGSLRRPTSSLFVVLYEGPDLMNGELGLIGDIDGHVALVVHAQGTGMQACLAYILEIPLQLLPVDEDGDIGFH